MAAKQQVVKSTPAVLLPLLFSALGRRVKNTFNRVPRYTEKSAAQLKFVVAPALSGRLLNFSRPQSAVAKTVI
jgi:hypothetical protein